MTEGLCIGTGFFPAAEISPSAARSPAPHFVLNPKFHRTGHLQLGMRPSRSEDFDERTHASPEVPLDVFSLEP
jgi:hypothetical protein